ncbi:hypothetical protein CLAFUW4_02863 [Fulvia fulva]|uniref:Microbial-type PARG catalytic domain-containing protein n=1 Tax=Passalora fulva TaxID=5499 RepID=A0A9Q8P4W9_PASFU|nr:uncharacterized protein CLAFUR5_02851 [Fulvia fulva]KAK4630843.1 hypothetical protein CLAFUR4_02857 [Fulvia fulva]KAK4632497.1 hypothetical protein CLAFUR0_02859 [Fulvia fulva]UJO13276.1 hypothetical protein CLAFUR5_02851 [Fulvia fulva]WPV10933.1 hypothetical protein CLAFUW4_02863 [Fulvia fulva]WPV25755.1 hypothetical protein CLAFUW7_02861 [Fulvia fulva]
MTRAERELRARGTVHRAIPEILRSSPRAKHGISQADLIVDPQPGIKTPTGPAASAFRDDLAIRVIGRDTLQVAAHLSERPYASKRTTDGRKASDERPNVTIHNMASLTRPGGAFITGGNSQEEFLCARTTLYASLFDDFYALPDIGGIFTPDVLVFRDFDGMELPKRSRYFINVISAGVSRHPENRGRYDGREESCSCGVSYCDRDRDIMTRKMKAVLRIAQSNGTRQLVLGAWGCGGLKHPVKEVAKLWRKVIAGSPRQRRPNAEQWDGIDEVIFAIPDPTHAREFRHVFDDILADDFVATSGSSTGGGVEADDAEIQRLIGTASSLELQIETAQSSFLKGRFKDELREVNHQIALGRAAKAAKEDDVTTEEDEDLEDDYVVTGFPGSDGEDNSFYRVGGTESDSDSEGAGSEVYEFRFGGPTGDSQTSQDELDELEEGIGWGGYSSSPKFNAQTGWFQGSIDQLSAHVLGGNKMGSASPRSPVLAGLDSDAPKTDVAVDGFLARFRRSDVDDQS